MTNTRRRRRLHHIERDPRVALGPVVERRNGYCGPAAISALTGVATDTAAQFIRGYSKQRAVKGARTLDVVRVLQDFGFVITEYRGVKTDRPTVADRVALWWGFPKTLGQLLAEGAEDLRYKHRAWLVVVTGHFMTVAGDWVADSSHTQPTHASKIGQRRRRIKRLYAVEGAS